MSCRDCGSADCSGWLYKYFGEPDSVQVIGACLNCDTITQLVVQMDEETHAHICAGCRATLESKLHELNRQFTFLLTNGVSRPRANKIMEQRINRLELRMAAGR